MILFLTTILLLMSLYAGVMTSIAKNKDQEHIVLLLAIQDKALDINQMYPTPDKRNKNSAGNNIKKLSNEIIQLIDNYNFNENKSHKTKARKANENDKPKTIRKK